MIGFFSLDCNNRQCKGLTMLTLLITENVQCFVLDLSLYKDDYSVLLKQWPFEGYRPLFIGQIIENVAMLLYASIFIS